MGKSRTITQTKEKPKTTVVKLKKKRTKTIYPKLRFSWEGFEDKRALVRELATKLNDNMEKLEAICAENNWSKLDVACLSYKHPELSYHPVAVETGSAQRELNQLISELHLQHNFEPLVVRKECLLARPEYHKEALIQNEKGIALMKRRHS
eukprot:TRINITY_DN5673_c0_g1_i1.p1 TRINITY_DN5673_c0_g1~~TRINITY_DN5673_c0_g1_i1.p1  ORF type:complete len:151 (+),score=26.86 TRINITY_DN5673_c0_g1_i1:26-478(+)